MRLSLNAALVFCFFCCLFYSSPFVFILFLLWKNLKKVVSFMVGRTKRIKYIIASFFSSFFSPFLSLSWHIWNIKQKQRLKSQSCDVLVAVRGWLLHADQGKKLLKTSNIFTVCRLSADCRSPEKALDTSSPWAQNGCSGKQTQIILRLYIYIYWNTMIYGIFLHVCNFECPPPKKLTHPESPCWWGKPN